MGPTLPTGPCSFVHIFFAIFLIAQLLVLSGFLLYACSPMFLLLLPLQNFRLKEKKKSVVGLKEVQERGTGS